MTQKAIRTINYRILIAVSLLFALVNTTDIFFNWWDVAVLNESAYSWGPEGGNPWYCASSMVYKNVTLVAFVLSISVIAPAVFFMLKGQKRKARYWLLAFWALIVLFMVNGWVD